MADTDRRRVGGRGDSWVVVLVRVAVAAVAGLTATWQSATEPGMIAAAAGAGAGVVLGELIGRSRARLTLALLLGFSAATLGAVGWTLLTRWAMPAEAVGVGALISAADATLLVGLAAGLTLTLRATGARWRAAAVVELVVMAAALSAPLSAHRGGAINRPLRLSDYAWSQGQDPVIYLQLAGGLVAVGLALFLVAEKRWVRALSAALMVLVASLGMGYLAALVRPAQIRSDSPLGLTGRGEEEDGGRSKGPRSLDQLDFRDNYQSKRRNAPVLVVLLHDDYEPPSGAYYFRQSAFSRYNGRRMVPALDVGVDQDVFEYFPSSKRRARWVPSTNYRLEVETSVALLQDHVNPVVLEAPVTVAPAKNPSPRRFRRTYLATSLALDVEILDLLGHPVGDPSWSEQVRQLYLEAPEDPRYRELATKIVERLPEELRDDPLLRVAAIAEDLSRRGIYSLRSRHASAEDPTASFLFGDMTGYCVHFAHAAVYLYRAAGVPARLATGYQYPAQRRGRGSSMLVRGGDAHAWPEIFVQDVGWVVVDISPMRNLEPPGMPMDPELQRMLGEMLRGQLEDQRRAALELGQTPVGLSQIMATVRLVARGLLGLVAVLLLLSWLGKSWRRLSPRLSRRPEQAPRLAYRLALDRLSEVGLRRARGEPPERFAHRVADRAPSLSPLVRAASARALGSRVVPEPAATLAQARAVRRELRRAVPAWRRALGVLDPISWLRVR